MKKFTPLAMKCSQKDWDSIKGRFKKKQINSITSFEKYDYLINFDDKKTISNIEKNSYWDNIWDKNPEIHETFNAKIFLNACGIDCDIYEITKEQILQLHRQGNHYTKCDLDYLFPDAFKKELTIGRWYKNLDKGYEKSICCVIEVNEEDKDLFSGYGIDYVGEYFYGPNDTTFCGSNNWQEATAQEV